MGSMFRWEFIFFFLEEIDFCVCLLLAVECFVVLDVFAEGGGFKGGFGVVSGWFGGGLGVIRG